MTEKYFEQIANLLNMLHSLDRDLNLVSFNETEKKIYYTIAYEVHNRRLLTLKNNGLTDGKTAQLVL